MDVEFGYVQVGSRWIMHDRFGRFISMTEASGRKLANDLITAYARFAALHANDGPARKDYGRRPKLRTSFRPVMYDSRSGIVQSHAPHARSIDEGSRAHPIPNAFGMGITVMHPGTRAYRYMDTAKRALRGVARGLAERAYPY